ncbi:hypothetical protein CK203_002328 [Vitis vinifera]|uniref:Uncharacterized protein n=1 Tax=Vitis vinifera TaxID=29760 RepID=A0A438KJU0_VITVI|nr:hypothetical protein CK203_002328 [Vitis vinifera]
MYGNGKVCKLKSNHLEPSLKDSHDLLSNMGDTILTSNNMHEMEILKQLMAKEFEAKNLGA